MAAPPMAASTPTRAPTPSPSTSRRWRRSNDAPVITSNGGWRTANVGVAENTKAVTTVVATDLDGPALSYAIAGGADAGLFAIDAATGALIFKVSARLRGAGATPITTTSTR